MKIFLMTVLFTILCVTAPNAQTNILIAYFTMPETEGVDAVSGASRQVLNGQIKGNIQLAAEWIQKETGGDLFAIETVQTYPGSHRELLDFAQSEQRQNKHPVLKGKVTNLAQYDTIFIGYPIWWYTLPMPLYSFFDQYELAGKTIIPFCVHGGSGFADTIQKIRQAEPKANMLTGWTVSRNSIARSESEVANWVRSLNLK
jgi:flavodoxin